MLKTKVLSNKDFFRGISALLLYFVQRATPYIWSEQLDEIPLKKDISFGLAY